MASTLTIPLTTLPVGATTFGPVTIADTDTRATLTVDRTVTGGLNSLTSASTLAMEAQMSGDGGATWHAVDAGQPGTVTSWTTPGGIQTFTDRNGVQHAYTSSSGTWPLFPGTSRLGRAVVTVTGSSSVAISGSIATS